jgi:hypothetical protein
VTADVLRARADVEDDPLMIVECDDRRLTAACVEYLSVNTHVEMLGFRRLFVTSSRDLRRLAAE